MSEGLTAEDVRLWLQERYDNCVRIAKQKTGEDAMGWIEDAAYFEAAIRLLPKQKGLIDWEKLTQGSGD